MPPQTPRTTRLPSQGALRSRRSPRGRSESMELGVPGGLAYPTNFFRRLTRRYSTWPEVIASRARVVSFF